MSATPACMVLLALVLLVNLDQGQGMEPVVTVTSPKTAVKTGDTFKINCIVMPYNDQWVTEVVKTQFKVKTPAGDKYTLQTGDWPYTVAKNSAIDAELQTATGGRYSASYKAVEKDNSTTTSVTISSTKPEDSGTWACRVWKDDVIIKNVTSTVDLQVDGPIKSVKIYVEATPGNDVPVNLTLSAGFPYTFIHGLPTRVTCDVGVPSSKGPAFMIVITDDKDKVTDITKSFAETAERSTTEKPGAGGLVQHTTHVGKVNSKFMPSVYDHGSVFSCLATLSGYPAVNASFTLNIESAPEINCPKQVVAPPNTTDSVIGCTVVANPPVTSANWTLPEAVAGLANNVTTTTNKLTGITLASKLTISRVTKDYYGSYILRAVNKHGTTAQSVTFRDKIVSAASGPPRSLVLATIASLILGCVLRQ